jgi:cold shock protein
VHFSHLWNDGIPEAGPGEVVVTSGGFRETFEGETVDFEWETPGQDGYDFRATTVAPRGRQAPHRVTRHYKI